jgi:putative transposase
MPKTSRFTEEQIIRTLKELEAGAVADEVSRRLGVTKTTLYRWKAKYGGLELSEAKRLKALDDENRRLKRMVADLSLDNQALKDLLTKKW